MSDKDAPYKYTDNQGHDFVVWAGSEGEAWRLASTTIQAHDNDYRAELEARQDAIESRHAAYSKNVDMAIDVVYQRSKAYTRAEISKGAGKNGLQGSLARDETVIDPNIYYIGGGGDNGTSSNSSTSQATDATYSSGYGLSCVEMFVVGVIVAVIVVFMVVWL